MRRPVLALLAVVATAGCGGAARSGSGAKTTPASAQALLTGAKGVLDASQTVHFSITSTGAAASGTTITGGAGDIERPDRLRGTLTLNYHGLSLSLKVLAGGGRFYVQTPFQSGYTPTDPATYGLPNPAGFIDPNHGLSSLLRAVTQPVLGGAARVDGDVCDTVSGDLPGAAVTVLPDANRSVAVKATFEITTAGRQLRRVVLSGPFTSTATTTYVVDLTGYGEAVRITLPAS